jgi:hypothetical protein
MQSRVQSLDFNVGELRAAQLTIGLNPTGRLNGYQNEEIDWTRVPVS